MGNEMRLLLRILGNDSGLKNTMTSGSNAVRKFSSTAQREFRSLRGTLSTIEGKLAGLGVTIGAFQTLRLSAGLDKGLTQMTQTAGVARDNVKGLRSDFFAMGKQTGKTIEDLKQGNDTLIQSGLNLEESRQTLKGINVAMAVTSAQAETLAAGLTVASTAFEFDLSRPGMALDLLDRMTVAGRLGNAELENLSMIFGRVGVNAKTAGFSFDKTLAFIETLSLVERNPERLSTLVDSTLRIFTNMKYMKDAQKGTGVKFFDAKGSRRDALDVLGDIRTQYSKLTTDQARSKFIQKAFGDADLDTIKGIRTLLQGDTLAKAAGFTRRISGAGGTLNRDMKDALDNSIDQTGRLKNTLREAADSFAQPINKAVDKLIQYGLNKKSEGGLELSGKQIIAGGLAAAAAAYAGGRFGGPALKKFLQGTGSLASGVATGKALEYGAGVTPVFVVNMPGGGPGGSGLPGGFDKSLDTAIGKGVKNMGGLGRFGNVAAIGGAALSGYGLGWLLNRGAGWMSGKITQGRYEGEGWLGLLLYDLMHRETRNEINMDVKIDAQGRVSSNVDGMNNFVTVKANRGSFNAR